MGIYYYAVDVGRKEYFSPPDEYAIKSPGIFHPENPFPHMVIMKNIYGSNFEIWDDCSSDIPPEKGYKDITTEVYKEYLDKFNDYFSGKEIFSKVKKPYFDIVQDNIINEIIENK